MPNYFEALKYQNSEEKKNAAFFKKYGDRFKVLFTEQIEPKLKAFGFEGQCPKYKLETEDYTYFLEFDLKDRELKNLYAGVFIEQLGSKTNYIPDTSLLNHEKTETIELKDCIINFNNYRKAAHNRIMVENNEGSFQNGIAKMMQLLNEHIFPFFNQYKDFPKPFSDISFEDYKTQVYPKTLGFPNFVWTGLLLAKINKMIGETEKAIEIAKWAKGYQSSETIKKQLDLILNNKL